MIKMIHPRYPYLLHEDAGAPKSPDVAAYDALGAGRGAKSSLHSDRGGKTA